VSKRDFLALEDWTSAEIDRLLARAARCKRGDVSGGLEKKVLAMMFMQPSIRTRTSFELAMYLHGGKTVQVESGTGSAALETEPGVTMDGEPQEHIMDLARVFDRSADAIGVRAFDSSRDWAASRRDTVIKTIAQQCRSPVINLGSSRRQPCQALADSLTLQERLGQVEGKRFVLTWAWRPDVLSTAVAASAGLAAARLGMEIVIARPEGYELDAEDTALIRKTAQQAGGRFVHISDDPDDALVGADAVYVASWGSIKLYGKPDQEREARAGLQDWRLTASRLRSTRGGKGLVMHALPVRRNVEVDDQVLAGPSSAVWDQAENRLHVQRALLLELIGDR
jgi:N-acetylornithine carbamoyltransferase